MLEPQLETEAELKAQASSCDDDGCDYRGLFEGVPVGLYRTTPSGQFLDVNPAMVRMLGYPDRATLLRTDVLSIYVNPQERERWKALVAQGNTVEGFELQVYRYDGKIIWGRLSIHMAQARAGEILYYAGALEDLTKHKQIEQALRQSENQFRHIIASNVDGMVVVDQAGYMRFVNPAAEALFGASGSELLGKPFGFPLEPKKVLELDFSPLRGHKVLAEMRVVEIEWEAETANLASLRDITNQRQIEDQIRKLSRAVEQSPSTIVITDVEGNIEYVNPRFEQTTGYTPAEAVGLNPRILKSGKMAEAQYKKLWETIKAGNEWHGEFHNVRKNGEFYWELASISSITDNQGTITHFLAVKEDITERKRREHELEGLVTVANALRAAHTRADMLPIILAQLILLFKAEGAALAMNDPMTNEVIIELGRGDWSVATGRRLQPTERVEATLSFFSHALHAHKPAISHVPLIVQGQTVGTLWVGRATQMQDDECRLLAAIGDIAANAIHRATLFEQTEQRLKRLASLHTIDRAISSSFDLRVTLDILLAQVIVQLGASAADILLLNPHTQLLEWGAARGFYTTALRSVHIRLGEGYAGRAALERRILAWGPTLKGDQQATYPLLPDPRAVQFAAEHFVTYHVIPLIAKGQVKGVFEIFHRTPLEPDPEWLEFLEAAAVQGAIAIDNAELFAHLQHSNAELALAYEATIEGWSRVLDLRDHETEGHSQRVTEMTLFLARKIGIGEPELVHIRRGALLHDIGKMGIPDSILLKPGPLTDEEWMIMRLHPLYAYEMLSPIAYLRPALDIPYCHHERWDGTGYPRGLRGDDIPLAARIFAVVDVWDALQSNRPYRRPCSASEVYGYISAKSGSHFDPKVVEVFLAWFAEKRYSIRESS